MSLGIVEQLAEEIRIRQAALTHTLTLAAWSFCSGCIPTHWRRRQSIRLVAIGAGESALERESVDAGRRLSSGRELHPEARWGHLHLVGGVGQCSLFEHVGTKRPAGRDFERHDALGEITVWLERGQAIAPTQIQLRRRPWPMGPIEVTWEGGPGGELGGANIISDGH